MYRCICTHTDTNTHTYAHVYICIYVFIHVRKRHTHTYTRTNQLAFAVFSLPCVRTYITPTPTPSSIQTCLYAIYTRSKYVCICVYAWYLSSSIHTLLSVCLAVSCSVLQCVAVCCGTLQCYNGWHTYILAYKRCFIYDTVELSRADYIRALDAAGRSRHGSHDATVTPGSLRG